MHFTSHGPYVTCYMFVTVTDVILFYDFVTVT